ncbi:MAG: hypothetical protein EOO81_11290, partial [Oxalobacteraceae bacterium]
MNRNTRHLLTLGVSALALNALPAYATGPGIADGTVTPGTTEVFDLTDLIGGPPADGHSGVTGTPAAVISGVPTGQVLIEGNVPSGNVNVSVTGDDVSIAATATDVLAPTATIAVDAIYVNADSVGGNATAGLQGFDDLLITATAAVTGSPVSSVATATIGSGAIQLDADGNTANANLTTDADSTLEASAIATAEGSADTLATAYLYEGAGEYVYGVDSASANVANAGATTFLASASAGASTTILADNSVANASVDYGIYQYATASDGTADASIDNAEGASLDVIAEAGANGSESAAAVSSIGLGFYNGVDAYGADAVATASFSNAGDASIVSTANSTATNDDASANANIDQGLTQDIYSDDVASADFSNSGGYIHSA